MFNFSIISIFLAVGLIIASVYVIPLSNTYGKEFKKWVFFRTGSHAISKCFMIINVLIVVGLLFTVIANAQTYQNEFKETLIENIISLAPTPDIGGIGEFVDQDVLQEQTEALIRSSIEQSPLIISMMKWMPILIVITAWFTLEFFRSFIFSNFAGIFNAIFIRINGKRQS
ncbi:hypothetical protein ACFLQN_04170 [Candidatus Aenigmatarchaeota archaeon]